MIWLESGEGSNTVTKADWKQNRYTRLGCNATKKRMAKVKDTQLKQEKNLLNGQEEREEVGNRFTHPVLSSTRWKTRTTLD